jgi:type II secretory pathway pseudopilin PulG
MATEKRKLHGKTFQRSAGFTVVEVIIAGIIMIILCIGTLTVFSYATRINRGNSLRAQALTVLQKEVEEFRSFKFVPVGSDTRLNGGSYPNYKTNVASVDGTLFNVSVTIDNDPSTPGVVDTANEATCKLKEIKVTAVLANPQTGWLADLKTDITFQRVRGN